MTKKSNHSGNVLQFFFKIVGKSRLETLLAESLLRFHHLPDIKIPVPTDARKILFICPIDPLTLFRHFTTMMAIRKQFPSASITVLCDQSLSSYIKQFPDFEILEYDSNTFILFSKTYNQVVTLIKKEFDICVLLEPDPSLEQLYLAGRSEAKTRVGYAAGKYPFLNLRAQSQQNVTNEISCALATVLGAQSIKQILWDVTKESRLEIQEALKAAGLKKIDLAIGVDLLSIRDEFSSQEALNLLGSLQHHFSNSVFMYTSLHSLTADEIEWLSIQKAPLIAKISIAQLAALAKTAAVMVTTSSISFEIAQLVGSKTLRLLKENESSAEIKPSVSIKTVAIKSLSQDHCKSIINSLKELIQPQIDSKKIDNQI